MPKSISAMNAPVLFSPRLHFTLPISRSVVSSIRSSSSAVDMGLLVRVRECGVPPVNHWYWGGSPSRCPRYNRALPAASDAASLCKLPQTQQGPARCCGRGPAYCSCYGNLRASSALRGATQKVLLEVGVVFQPSCGGLLVLVALVLVQHEV